MYVFFGNTVLYDEIIEILGLMKSNLILGADRRNSATSDATDLKTVTTVIVNWLLYVTDKDGGRDKRRGFWPSSN